MIVIKKHSENAFATFSKIRQVMETSGKSDKEIGEYFHGLMKMNYEEWTAKVNNDFKGIIAII